MTIRLMPADKKYHNAKHSSPGRVHGTNFPKTLGFFCVYEHPEVFYIVHIIFIIGQPWAIPFVFPLIPLFNNPGLFRTLLSWTSSTSERGSFTFKKEKNTAENCPSAWSEKNNFIRSFRPLNMSKSTPSKRGIPSRFSEPFVLYRSSLR